MGWWDDWVKQLSQDVNANIRTFDQSLQDIDRDLEKQKGIVPGILRGVFRAFQLFYRAVFRAGHVVFPGPIADPKILFAASTLNVPKESWDATIDQLARIFDLDAETKGVLRGYGQAIEGTSPVVQGLGMLLLFVGIMQFLMSPSLGKIAQAMYKKYRPAAPDPGSVLAAAALDPTIDARIWEALERNGFTKSDIELMFAGQYARIPVDMLREIFYRQGMPVTWLDHRLEELRFTPERREEIKATFPALPSVQDLIYMQGREAFEPDMIGLFGLGAESPTDILEYTRKQGISDDLVMRYWYAHWTHPSWTQVMEMLHRGVVDWKTVYQWYRAVEIPPFWREAMTKISFSPYTRVDVRRMHAMGILDDNQLVQAYRDLGFDVDHAQNMAVFTKRYNLSAEINDYVKLIIKRFRSGAITRDTALRMMLDVGVKEDKAGYDLDLAEYEEFIDRQEMEIENLKLRYISRQIDRPEVRNALNRMNLPAVQVSNYLLKWDSSAIGEDKFPSKTDLEKFFHKQIIREPEWREEMRLLGYPTKYVDWYYREMTAK